MTSSGDRITDDLLAASRAMREEALEFRAKFEVFIAKLNEVVRDTDLPDSGDEGTEQRSS